MKNIVRVLKAFADPNRLKIVKLLEKREYCVCELQEALGIAQPTVSKHMGILENAGLVDKRREAKFVLYYLTKPYPDGRVGTLVRELCGWLDEEGEIERLLEQAATLDRVEIIKRRSKK